MAKLIYSAITSLDGYVEDTDGKFEWAAPDEEKLGKSQGYPIAKIGNNKDWYYDESVRVGSFTHQAEIPGLYQGKVNVLQPAPRPMSLGVAARAPDYRWNSGNERDLSVDDYLARRLPLVQQQVHLLGDRHLDAELACEMID